MAVTTFKKEVWESAILEAFHGISVAEVVTTAPSSVEGSKAIFNAASLTSGVQAYAGTVEWEQINTAAKELVFDTKKYFAFAVDDCDKVQLAGDVMLPLARQCAYDIKAVIDTDIFAKAAAKAPSANTIGAKSAGQLSVANPAAAYDFVVDLGTKLDKKNVPTEDRFVIAPPDFINLLAKDARVIDNAPVLANGIVQGMQVNGMQIVKSNNLPANNVLALSKRALGFGKQIDKTEAMRLQNSFSDGIRGLVQYGVTELQENGIALLHYKLEA